MQAGNRGIVRILEVCVKLKYPSSSLLPEIAEAGGFLQGDQGSVMTPGFPKQNYEDGALYQVHTHMLVYCKCTLSILFDSILF